MIVNVFEFKIIMQNRKSQHAKNKNKIVPNELF